MKKIKREEGGRSGGREQGSDLDMDLDPWKIFWLRIRQNDADSLDLDPQQCFSEGTSYSAL